MSSTISWNLQMSVMEGRLDDVRALARDMVASTEQESGTTNYEWFLSDDGSQLHFSERYTDSDAALIHMSNFGSQFAGRFIECLKPTSFSIYGEPSDELRAALDGLGAKYYGPFGGFSR